MLADVHRCVAILALLAAPAAAQDARALFLAHCASCHGESGDGKGTAQLDRPARSFRDGGFSYGNTPEALLRTIAFGIPGTPMPAAPSILSEAERRALADYVISLGPPGVVVKPGESVLAVRDRPIVARGKLPPIAPDLPERPRGLLVGTTEGLTFEYRVDDVRLLGVRQGGFADRRDWVGRGGDVLMPLGKVVWLAGKGDPGAMFAGERPLVARLASTWVDGARCGLSYRLGDVLVDEAVSAASSAAGSGFSRRFSIRGPGRIALRVAEPGPAWIASGGRWCARRREDGVVEAVSATGLRRGEILAVAGGAISVGLALEPDAPREIALRTILAPAWDDAVQAAWLAELAP